MIADSKFALRLKSQLPKMKKNPLKAKFKKLTEANPVKLDVSYPTYLFYIYLDIIYILLEE